jgi:hypothetical protein
MANLEVIALDTVTPQLKAPQAGDGYAMPRPVAVTGTFDVTGAATATSLALGGATLGANAFAVTGSSALTGALGVTGAATATSLALGGATLGANAFAVTGNSALTGTFGVTGAATATSLALGGATLGTNTIAVTGSSLLTGAATITEPVGSTALTLTGATQTTAIPVFNATQTWNNVATTFTSIKLNVTDTTSATASLLADFQVGASSKFAVRKDGSMIIAQGAILRANSGSADGEIFISSVNNGNQISISDLGVTTRDGISFSVTSAARGTRDVFIYRKAAASLQFGAFDAAAPVAQTMGPKSVVAGTSNTAGQNFTVRGSQGTGTGVGGDIIFQVAAAGSSGTAQNALATAMRVYNTKTVAVGSAFTVATLPAAGTQGRRAWVTDALAPTFLGTLTGGGAVVTPVFDNGTAWVAG